MSKVKDNDKEWRRVLRDMADLSGLELSVGVLADAPRTKDDENLVDVATWNEYGTKHTPARPFMRITADEKGGEWQDQAAIVTGAVIDGRLKPERAVDLLGNQAVGDIQETIGNRSKLAPNSPNTIKIKGSDAPLIDTGHLKQNISYEVK